MNDNNKYSFSYTTSSLRLNQMIMVANHVINGAGLDFTSDLGNGNSKTGSKMLAE